MFKDSSCQGVHTREPNFVKTTALIDDQSKCSLAKNELFDLLNVNSEIRDYKLQTRS